jgi:hypothetical protein
MNTIEPREAFRCNSGTFGSLVGPVASTLRYDPITKVWTYQCDGPHGLVIESRNKALLSRMMDWFENTEGGDRGGRLDKDAT